MQNNNNSLRITSIYVLIIAKTESESDIWLLEFLPRRVIYANVLLNTLLFPSSYTTKQKTPGFRL